MGVQGVTGAVNTAIASFNTTYLNLAEHWDPFLTQRADIQKLFWYDRIPRQAYQLFSGLDHKRNVFRGGLVEQGGISGWSAIAKTTGATDNCLPPAPSTYDVAYEELSWTGWTTAWASQTLCVEDLKYQDYALEQTALYINQGVEYGRSIQEVWNREQYLKAAVTAKRAVIVTEGATNFAISTEKQFSYDPALTMSVVNSYGSTVSVPYLTYASGIVVGTLNWDFLDFLREELSQRAAGASLSKENDMPVYGLVCDVKDIEKMTLGDPELRADWRALVMKPIIESYSMAFRQLRGWSIMHDVNQPRFRVIKDDGTTVTAARVLPKLAGRVGKLGNIPEPDPDYYNAELALAPVFMNDILVNEFVPAITTVGEGTYFGPANGLNGQWTWLNILNATTNPLGEKGNFYGRIQVFPKPGVYSTEATAILYRRCPQVMLTGCPVEAKTSTVQAGTAVALKQDAVAGDLDSTNNSFWVTLVKPIAVGIGTGVTVTYAGGSTKAALAADTSQAPKYKFVYVGADPATTDLTTTATVTVV